MFGFSFLLNLLLCWTFDIQGRGMNSWLLLLVLSLTWERPF